MGSWSDAIFGDDMACDVRDFYRERIKAGDSAERAITSLKKEFAQPLRESDVKWTIWIALAAAQLEGREVSEDVREKALKGIAWSEDPDKGGEHSPFGGEALAALRKKLGGKTPRPKQPKPKVGPGEKGDVLAVQFPNGKGEAIIVVCGPSGNDRAADYGRIVLLVDLSPKKVTPQAVEKALQDWRHYREQWPNGLGRAIACYDARGKLPARRTRLLLQGVTLPPEFEKRMRCVGAIHRSADIPWVVETDMNDWNSRKWAIDPDEEPLR